MACCTSGTSRDHRPDLPQLKINVSTLDPLGLPLTATIVSGEKADDPLYLPEIERVRATLERRGLLYVGDSKMAALKTRVQVSAGGDDYLCPLPATQVAPGQLAELLAPVVRGELKPVAIKRRNDETGRLEKIAEGYQCTVTIEAEHEGGRVEYEELRLVVCSLQFAKAQKKGLAQRIKKATAEITRLNQKKRGKARPKTAAEAQAAVERILHKYLVVGLLEVRSQVERDERTLRAYKDRPATVRVTQEWTVQVVINRAALKPESTVKDLKMQFQPIKTAVFTRLTVHSLSEAALMYSRLSVGWGLGQSPFPEDLSRLTVGCTFLAVDLG